MGDLARLDGVVVVVVVLCLRVWRGILLRSHEVGGPVRRIALESTLSASAHTTSRACTTMAWLMPSVAGH